MSTAPLFYSYPKCSTCRRASQWLAAHSLRVTEKPIYTEPPTPTELRRMLAFQDGQLRRLFNTSGIQYRERSLATKLPAMTEADALKLLASDGRLVKRPFLLSADFGLVGFDESIWAAAFGVK